MIAYLKGKIINKSDDKLIINVSNVGYEVFTTSRLVASNDADIELYIHHHIREDQQTLYGFSSLDERDLFRKLISVSGVGPKSALSALGAVSASDIVQAIYQQDHNLFTSVPGIGNKTAQRLVLELKNKINPHVSDQSDSNTDQPLSIRGDIVAALEQLGYSPSDINDHLREVDLSGVSVEEGIKIVLKSVGSGK